MGTTPELEEMRRVERADAMATATRNNIVQRLRRSVAATKVAPGDRMRFVNMTLATTSSAIALGRANATR